MKTTTKYQVIITNGESKEAEKILSTEIFEAESIKDAYAKMQEAHKEECAYVFPFADIATGEGVERLASYCQTSRARWELRNGNTATVRLKMSRYDIEDEISTATVAIWESLLSSGDMLHAFRAGYQAIKKMRGEMMRKSEQEYNPETLLCNPFITAITKATNAPLDRAMQWGATHADMTPEQEQIFTMFYNGDSKAEIAEVTCVTWRAVHKNLSKALYKVMTEILCNDNFGMDVFTNAGLTEIEVEEALAKLRKQSGK